MILVSLYDKKASEYHPPYPFENLISALRAYMGAFGKNPEANIVKYPEDFDLYQVGEFDGVTGQVTPMLPPQYLESMQALSNQLNRKEKNA